MSSPLTLDEFTLLLDCTEWQMDIALDVSKNEASVENAFMVSDIYNSIATLREKLLEEVPKDVGMDHEMMAVKQLGSVIDCLLETLKQWQKDWDDE